MFRDKDANKMGVFDGTERSNKLNYDSSHGETQGKRIARKKNTENDRIKSEIAEDINKK